MNKTFIIIIAIFSIEFFTGATWLPLFKAGAVSSNNILLSDGASFILQVDGTSKICLAGGC